MPTPWSLTLPLPSVCIFLLWRTLTFIRDCRPLLVSTWGWHGRLPGFRGWAGSRCLCLCLCNPSWECCRLLLAHSKCRQARRENWEMMSKICEMRVYISGLHWTLTAVSVMSLTKLDFCILATQRDDIYSAWWHGKMVQYQFELVPCSFVSCTAWPKLEPVLRLILQNQNCWFWFWISLVWFCCSFFSVSCTEPVNTNYMHENYYSHDHSESIWSRIWALLGGNK